MGDLATVTGLDSRRRPAWNPKTKRHSWFDIDEDGHHHKCFHCWVRYHSEPDGSGGFVKAWSHGVRSGRAKSMGRCPGPDRRPVLTVVASVEDDTVLDPTPESTAADEPAEVRLCARCNPPCGRPGRLYPGGMSCAPVVAAASKATAEWLDGLRADAARAAVAA